MGFMDQITSRPRDAHADTGGLSIRQFDDVVTAEPEGARTATRRCRAWRANAGTDTRARRQETR